MKAVRARRSEMNVPPSKKAHLTIATQEADIFTAGIPFLKRLGYASQVTVTGPAGLGSDKEEAAKGVVTVITHAARIGMPLAELVDLEKEKALTKTMINNYAKNNLLPPPEKKKYSRNHILLLDLYLLF